MSKKTDEKKRRPNGEGGLSWNEKRQRWIAVTTVGYDGRGKRIVRRGSGKTEAEALREMRKRVKAYESGLVVAAEYRTVGDAVRDWLDYGQTGEAPKTIKENRDNYRLYIEPHLSGRRLKDLRAQELDEWLEGLTDTLGTGMLKKVHSTLNRSIKRAMARGYVDRNVVELCTVPKGKKKGRPSRSLTLAQVEAILEHSREHWMYPYVVVSLTVGLRTEEVRALTWDRVHLEPEEVAGVPPHVEVWRSERFGGDTKTPKSRRTLELPAIAIKVLRRQRVWQQEKRLAAGPRWKETGLVFTTGVGTGMSADNTRRDFRKALRLAPGINPAEWTPRELRHSFVSLMSSGQVPIEEISRLVGHSSTAVTERVYRHELRPVIQSGARALDSLLGDQVPA
ncbi:site-specific integrase [Myceligenerans halotolerans]